MLTSKLLRARLLCAAWLACWLAPITWARPFKTVVIDAGHGAHDFGAQEGWVFEKHLALDIARRLERYLGQIGLKSKMTRGRDVFLPLESRSAAGNATSGAVFVSIHVNHASSRSASGLETFYHDSEGAALATLVQQHMTSGVSHGGNRGVKFARFKVLRTSSVPAVLVETGFLSNSRDRARLLDPAYREGIARCIGNALAAYRKR